MAKILVVVEASYSIPDPSGHHLVPGEIAEVEDTPLVRMRIHDGQLAIVTPPAPPVSAPQATSEPTPSTKTRAPRAQTDQESPS